MYPKLQELIHQAEFDYLQQKDIDYLKLEISTLKQRIAVYKTLRDKEMEIFQQIADKLVEKLPEEKTSHIESCLHQWIAVNRYCGMAMILNNPEFLERRLLEWLTEIVEANKTRSISDTLHYLLISKLEQILSEKDLAYIKPFLNQAQEYLGSTNLVSN